MSKQDHIELKQYYMQQLQNLKGQYMQEMCNFAKEQ